MNTQALRNMLEGEKGKQAIVSQQVNQLKTKRKDLKRNLINHERAREIVRTVGLETQRQLQFHISDITSLALEAVFDDPYRLVVDFVQRRNKTECDLMFERDDSRIDPISASGGGAVDVASFALRIASWSMQRPQTRSVIVLDEPMRFLSVDLQERASAMIKEVSDKLGVQFIIITHEATLAAEADKVFNVKIKDGITKIS